LGWRVSGATLRHPCRANSRQTTEAATGRPKRCASAARIGERTSSPASWACSAYGARNSASCSTLSSALRRPTPAGPRRLWLYRLAKALLESWDSRPTDAQDGSGLLQSGRRQGRKQHRLRGA
jgi:hypothetical protein